MIRVIKVIESLMASLTGSKSHCDVYFQESLVNILLTALRKGLKVGLWFVKIWKPPELSLGQRRVNRFQLSRFEKTAEQQVALTGFTFVLGLRRWF